MFFIFKNSRIFDVQEFGHVIAVSYLGLLATTKLKREDYKLSKYRLYIPVSNENKGISAKSLTKVLLKEVYRYYGLFTSIVSNRGI